MQGHGQAAPGWIPQGYAYGHLGGGAQQQVQPPPPPGPPPAVDGAGSYSAYANTPYGYYGTYGADEQHYSAYQYAAYQQQWQHPQQVQWQWYPPPGAPQPPPPQPPAPQGPAPPFPQPPASCPEAPGSSAYHQLQQQQQQQQQLHEAAYNAVPPPSSLSQPTAPAAGGRRAFSIRPQLPKAKPREVGNPLVAAVNQAAAEVMSTKTPAYTRVQVGGGAGAPQPSQPQHPGVAPPQQWPTALKTYVEHAFKACELVSVVGLLCACIAPCSRVTSRHPPDASATHLALNAAPATQAARSAQASHQRRAGLR